MKGIQLCMYVLLVILLREASGQEKCSSRDCTWGSWAGWSKCRPLSCYPAAVGVQERKRGAFPPSHCQDIQCSDGSSQHRLCRATTCKEKCPGEHEYFSLRGPYAERNCDNHVSPVTAPCRKRGCFCRPGYVRGPDGSCIPPSQCLIITCDSNEEFKNCSCEDLSCSKDVIGPATTACIMVCKPKCYCRPGLFRNDDGKCTPPGECPDAVKCGVNEHYDVCGSECKDSKCHESKPHDCAQTCVRGCFCDDGYVRHKNGTCVLPSQCGICPENEMPLTCGNRCMERKCGDLWRPVKNCTSKCDEGCFCKFGYLRNDEGLCVRYNECPPRPSCGKNQVYSMCWNRCKERKCGEKARHCPETCDRGCFCRCGFLKTPWGECVRPWDCPFSTCSENERFIQCGSPCEEVKCGYDPEEPRFCAPVCVPGCYCKKGFYRSSDRCVAQSECPDDVLHGSGSGEEKHLHGTDCSHVEYPDAGSGAHDLIY